MVFTRFNEEAEEQLLVSLSKLKVWLAELPLLDLPKTSLLLNDSLWRLESAELKPKDKLERAFCYLDYLLKLSELTYERISTHDAAKHEVRYAELFLVREMLLSYAEMVHQLLFDEQQKKLSVDLKVRGSVYALAAYAHAILRTYQLLMFIPHGVWRHVYAVYDFLDSYEKKTNTNILVADGIPLGTKPLSSFYAALLLASINPNQSEAFELEEAFKFFIEHGHELQLTSQDSDSCHYSFSLDSDFGPRHKRFDDTEAEKLYLDLSQLNERVGHYQEVLSMAVSKKIADAWCTDGERVFSRHKKQGPIDIIDGLVSACAHIQGTAIDENKGRAKLELPRHLMGEEETIMHFYHEYVTFEQQKTRQHSQLLRCELCDSSDNGLSLVCPLNFAIDRFDVGQFVAMKEPQSPHWKSALIRWLSLSEDMTIRLGVQLIAKTNQPVLIQSRKQQQIGYQSQGILATDTYPGYPANVLITPVYSYHTNEKVSLSVNGETKIAVLNDCVERTSRCLIFTYHIVT